MMNRILRRLVSLSTAALLAAGSMNWGGFGPYDLKMPVYGAELEMGDAGITMKQSAVWTEENKFKGELAVEISGLYEWLESQKKDIEAQDSVNWDEMPEDTEKKTEEQESEVKETEEQEIENQEIKEQEPKAQEPEEDEEPAEEITEDIIEETMETENPGEEATEETTENRECAENLSGSINEAALYLAWERQEEVLESQPEDIPEENGEEILGMVLVTRISEYFQVDGEALPDDCQIQELVFPGENNELKPSTEVKYPILLDPLTKETVTIKIPITLKEEFCYTENKVSLPVVHKPAHSEENRDEEELEQLFSKGSYLAAVREDGQEILAHTEDVPILEKAPTPADYTISVKTDSETPKAGQTLTYQITIANTGKQPLPLMSLESSIAPSGISGRWIPDKETELDASGRKAILAGLGAGEIRQISYEVKLPESLAEPVISTITAKAQKTTKPSSSLLVRGASLKTMVTALKADFSVSKSADRRAAAPGDTITYQICIRNTGERTLHSVLSTERFQAENIRAQFVEKEGVLLNGTKTQALISQIPPGEVFSLDAVVTLPENLNSQNLSGQELINQVLVRTKETGEKTVQSQAGVKIAGISPTPEPEFFQGGNGENVVQNGGASQVSDYPKTSDDTNLVVWAGILGLAGFAVIFLLELHRIKRKRKH